MILFSVLLMKFVSYWVLHGSSIYKSNTELGPTWFDWRRRTNLITDYQMTYFRAYYLHLLLFISTFYICQGTWYFCCPTLQFLALLGPSRVQSRWTMFLGGLLVIPDNFSFHHHGEIRFQKFSNTESRRHAPTPENPFIEVGQAHLKNSHCSPISK